MNDNLWINWNDKPNTINDKVNNIIKISIDNNNKILKNPNNIISILANDDSILSDFTSKCNFIKMITMDNKLKEACWNAEQKLNKHLDSLNTNKELYNVIHSFYNTNKNKLEIIDKMFLKKVLYAYRKNGIHLEKDKLNDLTIIKNKIREIEHNINNNLMTTDRHINIDKKDLVGLPNSIISKFKRTNDTYTIKLTQNIYNVLMENLENSDIKRKLETYNSMLDATNADKLMYLFHLRYAYAKLLSFDNYTNYQTELNIAKNSIKIKNFLFDLLQNTEYRYIKEIKYLKKDNSTINSWDIKYLLNKWKLKYGVNNRKIEKYFPIQNTIEKIVFLFSKLFTITINKINNFSTWHKSVISYEIFKDKKLLGYIFLDLFYRKNKYGKTKCYCLQTAHEFPHGSKKYKIPMSVITMNINSNNKFLSHNNIINLMREFGFAFYQLFGKSKYNIFSGTNVEYDFVEVVGLIYENLAWNNNILKYLSSHYKTKEKLSDKQIKKINKTKNLSSGIKYRTLILDSLYDLITHSSNEFINLCTNINSIENDKDRVSKLQQNLKCTYEHLYNKIMSVTISKMDYKINLNKNIYMPLHWYHLYGGNEAKYYSILWAEKYASDIYMNKIKHNPIDPKIHNNIIKTIMNNTIYKPSFEKIKDLLGREPELDNFLIFNDLIDNNMEYSFFNYMSDKTISIDNTTNDVSHKEITIKNYSSDSTDTNSEKSENASETTNKQYENGFTEIEFTTDNILSETTSKYAKIFN